MINAIRAKARIAIEAAASLTGKRFGLLVASSVVATSVIVAAAMTGSSGSSGLLGELLGRSLAASDVPVETAPVEEPEEEAYEVPEEASEEVPEIQAPVESSVPEEQAPAEPQPEPEEEAPPPEAPALPEAGQVKHVFVVSLTSPGYEAAFGAPSQMPYLSATLRPTGVLLSGYSLLGEAAPANAIAAISGQPPNAMTKAGCATYDEFPSTASVDKRGVVAGSGCVYPVSTLTLADQLGSGRFTWHAYLEGMADESGAPQNCVHPEPGASEVVGASGYSARLNPFPFFHSLLDLGDCSTNDVPATELAKDLKKEKRTSNFSYISPNLCNSGAAGQCPEGSADGAAAADAYLAAVVPEILASPAYKKDGLLIVTFGAVNPPPEGAPAEAEPLKVGTLLVSKFASPNGTDATKYDPYSLLRSVEELFGLSNLANAGAAKVKSFAPPLLGQNGGD